ncbi:PI-PLC X domain-containing protein 1 [Madurella mycetomatis]|uniref:PI-PLC X domain-containing protein 1 n=1 Tax=Madurella mycetomatis TaxID=100816 RepID=A0A175W8M7_9PEZI|nr:PI-PLC X domain-containing protein 1 [Madurella mycetomatis]
MPSKGVHTFGYIAVAGCSIELSVPGQTITVNELNRFWNRSMEVEAFAISSFFDKRGRFTFKVLQHGKQITEQWITVNAITGDASGGTMGTITETPTIFHGDNLVISYGFYEAGRGHDVLPNKHQCYITITPNYSNWIGSVAPPGSDLENKPFSRLVLPSAHDVGMNSMDNCSAVLKHVGGAVVGTMINDNRILTDVTNVASGRAISLIAPNIIISLSITQKDSLDAMLRIGARYFEFRPAHLHSAILPACALPDRLYFQHAAIPGMAYDTFLRGVVDFLRAHPTEIIVVQLRWDGVVDDCRRPSGDEKRAYLNEALQRANGTIVAGNLHDMKHKSIAELRRERKRLIMLDSVDSLSTYTDEGNATLDGRSIVEAFPKVLTAQKQRGKAFVNIQCQATATNIPRAVVFSVIEASVTTSCLLATKGVCDSKTLPWCRDNVLRTCALDQLVVMMNDWIDGATADIAVKLSRQRLAK